MTFNMDNLNRFRIPAAVLCIVLALLCFFVAAPYMQSEKRYAHTIESLDKKKTSVMEMSAVLLSSSVAVAAVPGDATTPIADQIAELNSYLIVVLGAIILEKFLLVIIAMVVFRGLIPVGLICLCIYLISHRKGCLKIGIHLGVLSLLLMLLIPCGVKAGDMIDKSFGTDDTLAKISEDIENINANDTSKSSSSKKSSKSDNLLERIKNLGKDVTDTATNEISGMVDKLKLIITDLMDVIAVMLVTTCVIPVLIFLILIWIMKYSITYTTQKIGLGSPAHTEQRNDR